MICPEFAVSLLPLDHKGEGKAGRRLRPQSRERQSGKESSAARALFPCFDAKALAVLSSPQSFALLGPPLSCEIEVRVLAALRSRTG